MTHTMTHAMTPERRASASAVYARRGRSLIDPRRIYGGARYDGVTRTRMREVGERLTHHDVRRAQVRDRRLGRRRARLALCRARLKGAAN